MAEHKTTLFSVKNKHAAGCGKPPHINGNVPGHHHSYFENAHGEQAIFVFDHNTKTGTLWMGDAGWEKSYPVVDGAVSDLILNEAEALWLRACWLAGTGQESRG